MFGSGLSVLKQSFKASIGEYFFSLHRQFLTFSVDKSLQLYKASSLGHGRQSVTMTTEDSAADRTRAEQSIRQSWEDESLIRRGLFAYHVAYGDGS